MAPKWSQHGGAKRRAEGASTKGPWRKRPCRREPPPREEDGFIGFKSSSSEEDLDDQHENKQIDDTKDRPEVPDALDPASSTLEAPSAGPQGSKWKPMDVDLHASDLWLAYDGSSGLARASPEDSLERFSSLWTLARGRREAYAGRVSVAVRIRKLPTRSDDSPRRCLLFGFVATQPGGPALPGPLRPFSVSADEKKAESYPGFLAVDGAGDEIFTSKLDESLLSNPLLPDPLREGDFVEANLDLLHGRLTFRVNRGTTFEASRVPKPPGFGVGRRSGEGFRRVAYRPFLGLRHGCEVEWWEAKSDALPAVRALPGPIQILVGPPGAGKTTWAFKEWAGSSHALQIVGAELLAHRAGFTESLEAQKQARNQTALDEGQADQAAWDASLETLLAEAEAAADAAIAAREVAAVRTDAGLETLKEEEGEEELCGEEGEEQENEGENRQDEELEEEEGICNRSDLEAFAPGNESAMETVVEEPEEGLLETIEVLSDSDADGQIWAGETKTALPKAKRKNDKSPTGNVASNALPAGQSRRFKPQTPVLRAAGDAGKVLSKQRLSAPDQARQPPDLAPGNDLGPKRAPPTSGRPLSTRSVSLKVGKSRAKGDAAAHRAGQTAEEQQKHKHKQKQQHQEEEEEEEKQQQQKQQKQQPQRQNQQQQKQPQQRQSGSVLPDGYEGRNEEEEVEADELLRKALQEAFGVAAAADPSGEPSDPEDLNSPTSASSLLERVEASLLRIALERGCRAIFDDCHLLANGRARLGAMAAQSSGRVSNTIVLPSSLDELLRRQSKIPRSFQVSLGPELLQKASLPKKGTSFQLEYAEGTDRTVFQSWLSLERRRVGGALGEEVVGEEEPDIDPIARGLVPSLFEGLAGHAGSMDLLSTEGVRR